jgi:hypothetical protein
MPEPAPSLPAPATHPLLPARSFTIPLYWGRLGLLPYPVPLEIVVGEPLEVPKYQGEQPAAAPAPLLLPGLVPGR